MADVVPAATIIRSTEIISRGNDDNNSGLRTERANFGKAEKGGVGETIFGNAGAPAFIHRELPVYPLLAKRLGKEGRVVLKLLIDRQGTLQNVESMEPSGFGFTEAAIEAVKKSTFAPAQANGEKIASRAVLTIRFNLKRATSGE